MFLCLHEGWQTFVCPMRIVLLEYKVGDRTDNEVRDNSWWIRLATPNSGTTTKRALCCLPGCSSLPLSVGKTYIFENGCLGGFYSIATGVLSFWSVYDVFVVLKQAQVGRSWSAYGAAGAASGRQVEGCVRLSLCTVTLRIFHLFSISYICQRCREFFLHFFLSFFFLRLLLFFVCF